MLFRSHDHGGDHQGVETAVHAGAHGITDLQTVVEENEGKDDGQNHTQDHGVVGDGNQLHEDEDGTDEHDDGQEGGQRAGEVLYSFRIIEVDDVVIGTSHEVLDQAACHARSATMATWLTASQITFAWSGLFPAMPPPY